MNRRDLIKTSFLAGCTSFLLTGCKSKKEICVSDSEIKISPKQTKTYDITAPLPFNFELIDEMNQLNSKIKKAKIKTLYNSIPLPLARELEGFHSRRGINETIKKLDDFLKYVEYSKKQGFDFVYCLNSPKPFSENDFKKRSSALFQLLDELKRAGVKKFKIANTQLLNLMVEKYPDFELQASTAFEYHNISQYANLIKNYPNIKLFDISLDENRNFAFLTSLKNKFPKVELELMLNEPCLRGCPARIAHCATLFCEYNCSKIFEKNWLEEFCKSGVVYPWNLGYYSAIGINRFKFVCSGQVRADIQNLDYLTYYLEMLENGKQDCNVKDFFTKVIKFHADNKHMKNIKLSEIKSLLPDINYFIKHGNLCSEKCGVDCFYCTECAKKIEKIII